MKPIRFCTAVSAVVLCVLSAPAVAGSRVDSHAPIGVMADHFHHAGEWMLSYRFMHMSMDGNRSGTDDISPDEIVTTEPNTFAGMEGQPPSLRVVPLNMDMDMHMLGAMYGVSDRLTLMVMGSYVDKSMRHLTYQGGSGTTELGRFTTRSSGFGDTRVAALVSLLDQSTQRIHLSAGLSLPTGSITESDQILAPNGMQPSPRLPYPMQLGSGTYDLLAGLSYAGHQERLGWGAQYDATLRVTDNDEDYRLGDEHKLSGWLSWTWAEQASSAVRLAAQSMGRIDGQDPKIVAPVQTADPKRQGGERLDLGFSLNLLATRHALQGQRLALEYLVPIWQDLNGPQLKVESSLTLAWQYAF